MSEKYLFKNSLVICAVFCFLSCSTLYQKKHSDECGHSFDFLKKNWRYDTAIKMYTWGVPVLNSYVWENFNPNCLVGLSQKEIEKLMGKPTKINRHNKVIQYYYGPGLSKYEQHCYLFYIDSNNILSKIEQAQVDNKLYYEPKK